VFHFLLFLVIASEAKQSPARDGPIRGLWLREIASSG
jgi:hypothetical protein